MDSNLSMFFLLAFALILPTLLIMAIHQNQLLFSPPKERDFASALTEWARDRGLYYTPQRVYVISGVYNGRWFAIGTANEENALRIRMSIKNPRRDSLQIFGDWLEESEVIAFINRFRIYSSPSELRETLFDKGSKLRDSLLHFPGLRARLELFSDTKDPNHLHYSLLTDLPGADTLETIMASMQRFCDAFEHAIAQEENVSK
ncbi:MAG TPA: hypothetical protein VK206_14425 [Anaerolineales bacterium]|nr:hypothetical protein [Anaerolineales bacterium]